MKIYKSHKKVSATPMNRLDYNVYRGWDLPEDEDGSDEGYLVEYLDGGETNHPGHKGYISWSPKRQFDEGYNLVLPEYQQRVVVEYNELVDRIDKLVAFLRSDKFKGVDIEEQARLQKQHKIMCELVNVLNSRIQDF